MGIKILEIVNSRQKIAAIRCVSSIGACLISYLIILATHDGHTTGMIYPEPGVLIGIIGIVVSGLCIIAFGFQIIIVADRRPAGTPPPKPVFLGASFIIFPTAVFLLWSTLKISHGIIEFNQFWNGMIIASLLLGFAMLVVSEAREEGHPVLFYMSILANIGYILAYILFPTN